MYWLSVPLLLMLQTSVAYADGHECQICPVTLEAYVNWKILSCDTNNPVQASKQNTNGWGPSDILHSLFGKRSTHCYTAEFVHQYNDHYFLKVTGQCVWVEKRLVTVNRYCHVRVYNVITPSTTRARVSTARSTTRTTSIVAPTNPALLQGITSLITIKYESLGAYSSGAPGLTSISEVHVFTQFCQINVLRIYGYGIPLIELMPCRKLDTITYLAHNQIIKTSGLGCADGQHGLSENVLFNLCTAPKSILWRPGYKVVDNCAKIPLYTAVASFNGGVYDGVAGVLVECKSDQIKIATEECDGSAKVLHITNNARDNHNTNRFYTVMWN